MIAALCAMAIAYRYYSAFLAARVAVLDDSRVTPANQMDDGVNYHPTNRWVLFGHHFAAISGAGPLIGPVLAAQFGYLPGLLWIVIGVCLAGAVQDFLVLAVSIRRGGKSLAQIAFSDVGKVAGTAAMIAILFILVIALAGLGKVVVNALGGEEVKFPAASFVALPSGTRDISPMNADGTWTVPAGGTLYWNDAKSSMALLDSFILKIPRKERGVTPLYGIAGGGSYANLLLPANAVRVIPGSSWGIFTIACTIPIALFVGLYMYRIRKGRIIEASIIGGVLTLGATIAGGWVCASFHWSIAESHRQSGAVGDGHLRLRSGGTADVGVAGSQRLSQQFPQDRHDRCSCDRRHYRQSAYECSGDQSQVHLRWTGGAGQDFPVPVHHHHVRGDQRISFAGQQRNHLQDAAQGIGRPHDRLWRDADRRIGWRGGDDRCVDAFSR